MLLDPKNKKQEAKPHYNDDVCPPLTFVPATNFYINAPTSGDEGMTRSHRSRPRIGRSHHIEGGQHQRRKFPDGKSFAWRRPTPDYTKVFLDFDSFSADIFVLLHFFLCDAFAWAKCECHIVGGFFYRSRHSLPLPLTSRASFITHFNFLMHILFCVSFVRLFWIFLEPAERHIVDSRCVDWTM